MSDGRSHLAIWALGGLSVLAIVVGLSFTGGPAQGAKERRDGIRYEDLLSLARCASFAEDREEVLSRQAALCPGEAAKTDPLTGQPYLVQPMPDNRLRLCASFELTQEEAPWRRRDLESWQGDCMIVELAKTP